MIKTEGMPSYDESRKVCTIKVRLKPDWRYQFWLNGGRWMNFQSEGGVKLRPVKVVFWTGQAR